MRLKLHKKRAVTGEDFQVNSGVYSSTQSHKFLWQRTPSFRALLPMKIQAYRTVVLVVFGTFILQVQRNMVPKLIQESEHSECILRITLRQEAPPTAGREPPPLLSSKAVGNEERPGHTRYSYYFTSSTRN